MATISRYYLYIMELENGMLYVGHTGEPVRRHKEHQRGHGCRTSRIFGAGKLLYTESFPDRKSASRRESQIKRWSRAKKLALTRGDFDGLKNLARRRSR